MDNNCIHLVLTFCTFGKALQQLTFSAVSSQTRWNSADILLESNAVFSLTASTSGQRLWCLVYGHLQAIEQITASQ